MISESSIGAATDVMSSCALYAAVVYKRDEMLEISIASRLSKSDYMAIEECLVDLPTCQVAILTHLYEWIVII